MCSIFSKKSNMNQTYSYNGFTYKNEANPNEYIEHDKLKPDNIFKYYGISKYSVDALLRGYLYASHPFDLNDTLDSSYAIYSSSNRLSKQQYQNFYKTKSKKELDEIYQEDTLNKKFIADFYNCSSSMFGIISMSGDTNNDLIWPHYTQEEGFQLMFKTHKLEQSIKNTLNEEDDFLGLYPLNYCKELKTIDLSKLQNAYISAFLYLTNVKMACWEYENEWRFIIGKNNMKIPYTKIGLHQGTDHGEIENRYVYYDNNLVERIVIGKNFFNGRVFKIKPIEIMKWELTIKENPCKDNNFYKDFLNYIISNLNDKFYISDTCGIPDGTNYRMVRRIVRANIDRIHKDSYFLVLTNEIETF